MKPAPPASCINVDNQLTTGLERAYQRLDRSFNVWCVLNDAKAVYVIETIRGERQRVNIRLDYVNAFMRQVGAARINGVRVVDSNDCRSSIRCDLGKPARTATDIEDELTLKINVTPVGGAKEPISRYGNTGMAVQLGSPEFVPLKPEACSVIIS